MNTRSKASQQRRNQILEAALRVFAEKGFFGARTDDIAREAGVSKGLLYWYFESKDAILLALLERLFEPDLEALEHLVTQRERSARERLLNLAQQALGSFPEIEMARKVAYEYYALASRPGPVREALQRYYRRYRDLLAALIAQGVERGEWRVDNPRELAITWLAQFEGLWLMHVVMPEEVDLPKMWMKLAHRLLRLLDLPQESEES